MADVLLLLLLWLVGAAVTALAFFTPGLAGVAVAIVGVLLVWSAFLATLKHFGKAL
jgi:hypothetical protein